MSMSRPNVTSLLLASFLAACATCSAVDIIAHRGASHDAPENTIASFKEAWKQGADAAECDIWLTKDGRIIVIHDDNTKKTAGLNKKVVEQTQAELRKLDAGSWKDPKWKGEKLPTLDEMIATVPKGRRIVIEIKTGPEIVPELERVLKASKRPISEFVIIAFNYDAIVEAKKRFRRIPAYWLHSYKKDKTTGEMPTVEGLIAKAKAAKAEGLNLDYKFPIDDAFVKQVTDAGLKLYVWTVNDADVARRLVSAGVAGITTDRPAWLREELKR